MPDVWQQIVQNTRFIGEIIVRYDQAVKECELGGLAE